MSRKLVLLLSVLSTTVGILRRTQLVSVSLRAGHKGKAQEYQVQAMNAAAGAGWVV